jgi:hypothetical protein
MTRQIAEAYYGICPGEKERRRKQEEKGEKPDPIFAF